MTQFAATLHRDLVVAIRSGSELLNPLAFFLLVSLIFALAFGQDLTTREMTGISAVWTTALFANMLAVEGLFRRDYEEGTLHFFLIQPTSTIPSVSAKLLAHWLLTGLPISLLAPLVGLGFGLSTSSLLMLTLTLLIGTPILTLIGGVGAALVVGLGRGGVLLTLLVMPLYIPVLLLGIGVCYLNQLNEPITSQLAGLVAILTGSLTIAPLITGPILRASFD